MKYVIITFLSILLAATNLQAGESGNLDEFQSVTSVSGGIRITFKPQGTKYNFKVGDTQRQISSYNESVDIFFGQHAEFASKGLSIILEPTSNAKGRIFKVKKEIDLRPIGGPLKIESFLLNTPSGVVTYGKSSVYK